MMTRASRLLKWIGAGTVVLAVAPIAYADAARHTATPSSGAIAPSSTSPSTTPGAMPGSAHCDGGTPDFAGTYTVAGRDDVAFDFEADGRVSELYLGAPAATGAWQASGDEIVWTAGGVTYTSQAHSAACTDPAHTSRVTSVAATPAGGSAEATGSAGSLGSDPLTLQRS
ncbi:hypothetical protein [Actinospica robiniae]|uniref:hypothetical protein n=1 Tax=Actinospica robiniae TaxID=304901 RepID=UPI000425617C|nr:hypothetical protein [Actinospica robiniae]